MRHGRHVPTRCKRRRQPIGGLALALVGVLALAAAPSVSGQEDHGLGMAPERFRIDTAQPGESYVLQVLLQNRRGFDDTIRVTFSGEAGRWATVDPPTGFTVPAGEDHTVTVRLDVPPGTGPGLHEGQVTFTGEPSRSTSGSAVRPSLGLRLEVTVGGQAVVQLSWISARAEDAPVGQPVAAFVRVRNDGNVRTTAEIVGQVLPFEETGPVLSEAAGSLVVIPGQTADVPLQFAAGLALGQYHARLGSADGSFSQTVEFKVVPPGAHAPAGVLRLLDHVPSVEAGRPLRVDGWFENTGDAHVASARLTVEVRRGGELVEVASSEPLAVGARLHANLTVYFTPEQPGSYTLSGQVTYDGYRTESRESFLTVTGGEAWSWWWLLIVLVALALLALWWAWRKGRRDRKRRSNGSR